MILKDVTVVSDKYSSTFYYLSYFARIMKFSFFAHKRQVSVSIMFHFYWNLMSRFRKAPHTLNRFMII